MSIQYKTAVNGFFYILGVMGQLQRTARAQDL